MYRLHLVAKRNNAYSNICHVKMKKKNTIMLYKDQKYYQNPYYKWQHYINKLLVVHYFFLHVKYKILFEVVPSEVTCKMLKYCFYNTENLSLRSSL